MQKVYYLYIQEELVFHENTYVEYSLPNNLQIMIRKIQKLQLISNERCFVMLSLYFVGNCFQIIYYLVIFKVE